MIPVFINMTGDLAFPHNGSSTDKTVSANETWTITGGGGDETFDGRIVRYNTLTINAGIEVYLEGGPWFVFVDHLVFGDTASTLSANGPGGTLTQITEPATALGGFKSDTAIAQGGAGGKMLLVCVREISGAAGKITSNGGDGMRNTSNAGSSVSQGGLGALSGFYGETAQNWAGSSSFDGGASSAYLHPMHIFMQRGHSTSAVGASAGGGSGAETVQTAAGSGIGAGHPDSTNVLPDRINDPTPVTLIELALIGCLGGGGGSVSISTTGTNNDAGGGGGGAVCVWVKTQTTTPTLSATGGANANNTAQSGGDGVTYIVSVP